MMVETSEKKGCSEHEKGVGHNGARYRTFHQRIFTGAERRGRNDQFGQVSQRRVEQSTYGVAGFFRNSFCCVTQQSGKRHDRKYREHEQ